MKTVQYFLYIFSNSVMETSLLPGYVQETM